MVAAMAEKPIVFALANPTPEIMPEEILEVRNDAIIATGRSDYPNQVTTYSVSHTFSVGARCPSKRHYAKHEDGCDAFACSTCKRTGS